MKPSTPILESWSNVLFGELPKKGTSWLAVFNNPDNESERTEIRVYRTVKQTGYSTSIAFEIFSANFPTRSHEGAVAVIEAFIKQYKEDTKEDAKRSDKGAK